MQIQIPALEAFQQHPGTAYGPPFWADPAGAGFTLTIPEGDEMWTPHEPSYQLALRALPELQAMTEKAVDYLGRAVDFARVGIGGEPWITQVECDARAKRVTLSLAWGTNVHGEWSFTFSWQERAGGVARWPWPIRFGFRDREIERRDDRPARHRPPPAHHHPPAAMRIPSIEEFRQREGTACGPPFWVDPGGADFTLTIPEGDTTWEPHEPSYRLALLVLGDLEALTKAAVDYLDGGIDFASYGIRGEPYLNHVECDARAETITLSMSWDADIYAEWSVTFFRREREEGIPRWCRPTGFAFRSR
jgi:hypothetical protein